MENALYIYNSLARCKQPFRPINPPYVGMYVCGPTVYGDAHLGHARPAITFDLVFRYLKHLGYKVRYVRNITDVGHLEHDADEGEDKIAKKARIENLEPMEVAQYYTNRYHAAMDKLNVLRPSIEPHASGHIIEQIAMIQKIIDKGFAYVENGSGYFDIEKYNKEHPYGILSGRNIEEMLSTTRQLSGQEEKHNPVDFALWKKAEPKHIMRWPSPWSDGFPGWHMECSAMGCKYLGETFDIHGGGMDLMFPHHESEIAQSMAANGKQPVKYWMHNNMITIGGQKMGKSLGNFITLDEFFNGSHFDKDGKEMLAQPYSPMTIRFFILQAHYRSTIDFSNEALQAAEKGYNRLMEAIKTAKTLKATEGAADLGVAKIENDCYDAMNDDFNSPIAIANLFEAVKITNSVKDGHTNINPKELEQLNKLFNDFVFDILGLTDSEAAAGDNGLVDGLMQVIINIRKEARAKKDWATSDLIRDNLAKLNITLKDGKDGTTWTV